MRFPVAVKVGAAAGMGDPGHLIMTVGGISAKSRSYKS
jgi:hypothetical protein